MTLNGQGGSKCVDINPNVLADEPSIVGELRSAINDANKKLETMKQESMADCSRSKPTPGI